MKIPGYGGKVIEVNLTEKTVKIKELNEKIARKYIGGLGLATCYFEKSHNDFKFNPLDPNNTLIIASGPFNGGFIPMSTKAILVFKSPLTSIFGASVIGGSFGSYMKWAGVDLIIIKGKASNPVYILIDDENIEIKDATKLWGLGAFKTERTLKEHIKGNASILTIGPAGEKLIKFACVNNDYWRQAGRTGGGTVFGSKNLKAIAIKTDRKQLEYYDSDKLKKLTKKLYESMKKHKSIQSYAHRGTMGAVEIANVLGFFPTRYWSKVQLDGYEKVSWDAYKEYRKGKMTCIGCPVACHQYVEINHPKYGKIKVSLEYENTFAIAGLCEITDTIAVAYLNMLMDDYGLDTISTGNVIAFAIEAYKRGKIKCEKTLEYGDVDSFIWLLNKIVKREGIGNLLAEGVAKASEKLELKNMAIHVKGLEPPGYDPRTLKGMILSYAVSFRGACHLRLMGYHADLMGLGGDRYSTGEEKVEAIIDLENKGILYDSLPICKFGRYIYDWEIITELLNAATGFNYEVDELKQIANNIVTTIRVINIKMGAKKEDDYLPSRFLNEEVEYKQKKHIVKQSEMEQMIKTYYMKRGWNENGVPKEKL